MRSLAEPKAFVWEYQVEDRVASPEAKAGPPNLREKEGKRSFTITRQ